MKWFSDLFSELYETPATEQRSDLVLNFFRDSDPDEKIKGIFLLLGGKLKRPVSSRKLKQAFSELTGISAWLLDESNKSTGSLPETLSLLLDDPPTQPPPVSLQFIFQLVEACRNVSDNDLQDYLFTGLTGFSRSQRLFILQLLCGSFKPGFKSGEIIDLFSRATGVPATVLLHQFTDKWHPGNLSFGQLESLLLPQSGLSFPVSIPQIIIKRELTGLSSPSDWFAEWKPSGAMIQLVKQSGKVFLFEADGSPVFKKYPDLLKAGNFLPDGTILIGVLVNSDVPVSDEFTGESKPDRPEPGKLQREKSRNTLVCMDIVAWQNSLLEKEPFQNRRLLLEVCVGQLNTDYILLPEPIEFRIWNKLTELKEGPIPVGIDGILLRELWQAGFNCRLLLPNPRAINAVLIYVQIPSDSGNGRLYELTLGVWNQELLTPIGKIRHFFSEEESKEIARFIKENTLERFGPVRTVKPALVFEIEFDSAEPSGRHKSGLVLRNPKIRSWLKSTDKDEAGKLSDLEKMAKKSLRTRDTEA